MRVVKRLWACRNGRSKTSGDARTTDIFANPAKGGPRRPGMQVIPRLILKFLTKESFLSIFNRQGTIASGGGKKMPRQANLLRRVQPVEVRMESRVSDPLPEMGQTAFQGKNLSLAVRVWVEMLKQDVTILLTGAGRFLHRNFPRPESKRARFPIRCCSRGSRDGLYPGSIQGHRRHFLGGKNTKKIHSTNREDKPLLRFQHRFSAHGYRRDPGECSFPVSSHLAGDEKIVVLAPKNKISPESKNEP